MSLFLGALLLTVAAASRDQEYHHGFPSFFSQQGGRGLNELPFSPSPPLPQAIDDLTSSDNIIVTPDSCDDGCYEGLIEREDHIVFQDKAAVITTGYAFYQGWLIDVRAYSPICRGIVERTPHVACFLLAFEDSLPFDDDGDRFVELMESYPDISEWFISGHSMGGHTALDALLRVNSVAELVPQLGGVVLLAAHPSLMGPSYKHVEPSIEIVSISAEMDCVATPENVEIARDELMPSHAVYYEIKGGDHGGFGAYDSSGRIIPPQFICPGTISRVDQLQQTVEIIAGFL